MAVFFLGQFADSAPVTRDVGELLRFAPAFQLALHHLRSASRTPGRGEASVDAGFRCMRPTFRRHVDASPHPDRRCPTYKVPSAHSRMYRLNTMACSSPFDSGPSGLLRANVIVVSVRPSISALQPA